MIRYIFIILAVLVTAATAIGAVQPKLSGPTSVSVNTTVIGKNSPFPVLGPIVVEPCAVEDCSDTPA